MKIRIYLRNLKFGRKNGTFRTKQAKNEGYEQIAEIFLITAENEKEHAKLFYEYIGNTRGTVNAEYPFELGTTEENLESAINGENEEWSIAYPEFAKIGNLLWFSTKSTYAFKYSSKLFGTILYLLSYDLPFRPTRFG